MVKALQATEATARKALSVFTPMELTMCADAHLAADALSAHELLSIVLEARSLLAMVGNESTEDWLNKNRAWFGEVW